MQSTFNKEGTFQYYYHKFITEIDLSYDEIYHKYFNEAYKNTSLNKFDREERIKALITVCNLFRFNN